MAGDLRQLKGVGEKTEILLNRLGIFSQDDLLHYYPRAYISYEEPVRFRDLKEGGIYAVRGRFTGRPSAAQTRRGSLILAELTDFEERIQAVWYNAPYILALTGKSDMVVLRGKVSLRGKRFCLDHPEVFSVSEYMEMIKHLRPVYGLTRGLSGKTVARLVAGLFSDDTPGNGSSMEDCLPEEFRDRFELRELGSALYQVHFPKDREELIQARNRLIFDEFLLFILNVRMMKEKVQSGSVSFPMKPVWDTRTLIDELPYTLTGAQMRAWQDVESDLSSHSRMARLIQGDVGSGKTIIAFLAMLQCVKNGYQAALMVPTQVLASQHYTAFCSLIQEHSLTDCRPVLLTGSTGARRRKELYGQIERGEANIVIGTHALIQEDIRWNCLALAVIDEQHRFGVEQRQALTLSERPPHLLVMSATPIPRTLAIVLYGDLDISVIDEMPAGRLPVKNCVVGTEYRPKAYAFLKKQILQDHQAYVICPMVEPSEGLDAENVQDYAKKKKNELGPDIPVGVMHGRLSPGRKEEVMEAFVQGEIKVLVSTTVIEVGVNVPSATVMMVENAERFGLAQLHQLRGRVGRGKDQAYCIFVQGGKDEEQTRRLEIMNRSNDGFFIAGEDLRMRGPGDFFGVRQSGDMLFRIADIYRDSDLLSKASRAAALILERDPMLQAPEHRMLKERLACFFAPL